jgi:hypothetical protein
LSGAPTADETAVAVYGYTHNTGNVVGGTGHLIGVVGRVDDGVNGKHDLIGVEGRIDSAGSAGALRWKSRDSAHRRACRLLLDYRSYVFRAPALPLGVLAPRWREPDR